MGEVYLAEHGRGQRAAVKLLTRERARDARYREGFRREIYALAQLDHPGIARIYDFGFVEEEGARGAVVAGTPWFAMEYVEGLSARRAALTWEWPQLREFALALLDALGHAHARHVLHRDLKPSNVLVSAESASAVALVDFGIAELYRVERSGGQEEAVESTYGTPRYMSPEQIMGEQRRQGPWTDLYAVGCLLWGLICGQTPHRGETSKELFYAHLRGTIAPFQPSFAVPEGVEAWLMSLLEQRPSSRVRRAADARRALLGLESAELVMPEPREEAVAIDRAMRPTRKEQSWEELQITEGGALTTRQEATRLLDWAPEREQESADRGIAAVEAVVPETWRRASGAVAASPVGLNLFGLRKLPFINRDAERDALWEVLVRAAAEDRPHGVFVSGAAGCGKSRLIDWLAERVHETGAATPVRVTHSRPGTAADGMASALLRWFQCGGMRWSEALRRLVEEFGVLDIDSDARLIDAAGLLQVAGSVDRPESTPGAGFGGALERNRTLVRIVEAMARRRPVLLWLDDVLRDPETLSFVRHLFGQEGGVAAPIVVVMTSRREEMASAAESVDALLSVCTAHLEVEALAPHHHEELVRRMLPFEEGVVRRLVERTEGRPLFAVQIVRDWVERGLVEEVEGGGSYRVEGGEDALPGDLHRLWMRRLEQLVEGGGRGVDESSLTALELAATLGRSVEWEEWRLACGQAGLLASRELVGRMVEAGLAVLREGREGGWELVHGLLVESLLRSAEEGGRLEGHHGHCAAALAQRYDGANERAAQRRAEHLMGAGRPLEAVGPIREAADAAAARRDYERALVLLERQREVLDAAGVAKDHVWRAKNDISRCGVQFNRGRFEEARALVERARRWVETGHGEQARGIEADVLAMSSGFAKLEGDLDGALELLGKAETICRELGDDLRLASCLRSRGFCLWQCSEYARSRRVFEYAQGLYESLGLRVSAIWCEWNIAWCHYGEGDYGRTRVIAERLLREAKVYSSRSLEASGHNILGELARLEGDWNEAIRRYDEAATRWRQCGARAAVIASLNMLLAAVGARRWELVEYQCQPVWDALEERGFASSCTQIVLIRVLLALARGDEDGYRDQMVALEQLLAEHEYRKQDLAWLAQQGASLAEELGRGARARELREMEARFWDDLGRADRAEEVRRALARG